MKAMILAAGEGKRLQPLTLKIPKPLLKVGSSSLIEDQINRLLNLGINDFVINISYLGVQIKESLKNHSHYQNISFIEEPYPYGTGGALVNAIDHLGDDPFILCNADIFYEIRLHFSMISYDFSTQSLSEAIAGLTKMKALLRIFACRWTACVFCHCNTGVPVFWCSFDVGLGRVLG